MKKLLISICYGLMVMLILVGCKKSDKYLYEVSIQTDRDSYALTSSSVQGIKMSPKMKTNDESTKIEYYWKTNGGTFIGQEDKVSVVGDSVIWSAISYKSPSAPSTATITLVAREKGTVKILATSNLTIEEKDSLYTVKK